MPLVTRMFASSEHAWDPMASSSAKSCSKMRTVPSNLRHIHLSEAPLCSTHKMHNFCCFHSLRCLDRFHSGNGKRQWERNANGHMHARASSGEKTWEPMACSSAKSCRKTRTAQFHQIPTSLLAPTRQAERLGYVHSWAGGSTLYQRPHAHALRWLHSTG